MKNSFFQIHSGRKTFGRKAGLASPYNQNDFSRDWECAEAVARKCNASFLHEGRLVRNQATASKVQNMVQVCHVLNWRFCISWTCNIGFLKPFILRPVPTDSTDSAAHDAASAGWRAGGLQGFGAFGRSAEAGCEIGRAGWCAKPGLVLKDMSM